MIMTRCCSPAAATIIDLLTKPLVSGKPEMEMPPITVKISAIGMYL